MEKSIIVHTTDGQEVVFGMDGKGDIDVVAIARSIGKHQRDMWGWTDNGFELVPHHSIARLEIEGIDPENVY